MKELLTEILTELKPQLDAEYAGWAVFGSAALALNGMEDMAVHDIDIVVPAAKIRRSNGLDESHFRCRERRRFSLRGMEVDISIGLEVRLGNRWMRVVPREICISDGIRYATLKECLRLLRLFGRPKDLEKIPHIEAFISTCGTR